jgi:hypothetical protein
VTPGDRATYHQRQSLKGRMTQARLRLVDAAMDQRNPSPELKAALNHYLRIEKLIKELG